MFIAAHPDDEPAGLVTYVSRGLHAKTALLTITRGEGGQNLVSSDLFDALGLVRTGEMMAASKFYGSQQYFTRAFDFGFSRSSDETIKKWGRKNVLEDIVRVIRSFRPLTIISIFNGSAQDGHGHHQAAGILAREAYKISGDPSQFPQLIHQGLLPWKAQQLYVVNRRGSGDIHINTGKYNPILGLSYNQIGTLGYSHHRSQGMGHVHAHPGTNSIALKLIQKTNSPIQVTPNNSSFEAFLNLGLTSLADLLPEDITKRNWLKSELLTLEVTAKKAQRLFSTSDYSLSLSSLVEGLEQLRQIQHRLAHSDFSGRQFNSIRFFLAEKERDFIDCLHQINALSLEAYIDSPFLTPGQAFRISIQVVNRSSQPLTLKSIDCHSEVLQVKPLLGNFPLLQAGEKANFELLGTVPINSRPSKPHWNRTTKNQNNYTVTDLKLTNRALPPHLMKIKLRYNYNGVSLEKEQAVGFLKIDRLRGTRKIPVHIVPLVNLQVEPTLQLVPLDKTRQTRKIQVQIRNNSPSKIQGKLELKTPRGWKIQPKEFWFSIGKSGELATFQFSASANSDSVPIGRASFKAVASINDKRFTQQHRMISVFDQWNQPLYEIAQSEIVTLDLQTPKKLKIGYIMGAGDQVPQTLEQIGMFVTALQPEDLATENLEKYHCIIAGIRAYQVRSDLVEHNIRLLKYVEQGGVFIVQYNTPSTWNQTQYGPYKAKIVDRKDRVTDETAPMTILMPEHRAFHYPNKITQQDFSNWVQERGLYFIQERDRKYKALLTSNDPGEPPLDGGLLVANFGKGHYVLTSYSWFRQLPVGVVGAIRLFTNLVSLGIPYKGEVQ